MLILSHYALNVYLPFYLFIFYLFIYLFIVENMLYSRVYMLTV